MLSVSARGAYYPWVDLEWLDCAMGEGSNGTDDASILQLQGVGMGGGCAPSCL